MSSIPRLPCAAPLLAFLLAFLPDVSARANVYATNIRLNGGTTNVIIPSGGSISIGYILNEAATAGVAINIKSGPTVVRTITLTNGSAGTLRGTNSVVWNGLDDLGQNVAGGTYTIAITAAAVGSNVWWQTSDDFNTNNYVWEPRGIAVNRNTNSLYYGRIFVANSIPGPHPESNPGDAVGFQKLNADGSTPADGGFGSGGWPWHGDGYSPWKVAVADDDRLYVDDFWNQGSVLSFDQTLSSNSLRQVLRADNWPNTGVNLNGPFITGSSTNLQVWMADDTPGGLGIRRWNVNTNGVIATNDVGSTIVLAGPASDLNTYPCDVAVDRSNRIYTIQNTIVAGSTANRLARFPAYAGSPESVATWKIGSGNNDLRNAYGVAVNSSGTYVAVSFRGVTNAVATPGSVRVFNTSDGSAVTTIGNEDLTDVDWDDAGNLYVANEAESLWQVFSPPGSNQATTVALPAVVVSAAPVDPVLSQPSYSNGEYHFTLIGEANVTYIIYASTDLQSWVPVATNTSVSPVRQITITALANQSYYRAEIGPSTPASPFLSSPAYAAGQFQFTLIGQANLTYIIQSSSNLLNWVPVLTNTSPSATRPITNAAPASRGFFRALSPAP